MHQLRSYANIVVNTVATRVHNCENFQCDRMDYKQLYRVVQNGYLFLFLQ